MADSEQVFFHAHSHNQYLKTLNYSEDSMTPAISRRKFLSTTAAAATIGLAGPAIQADGKTAANERLRLAVIGCGRRGRQLISVFGRHKDVEIPVICDVNGKSMNEAYELLERKPKRERRPRYRQR